MPRARRPKSLAAPKTAAQPAKARGGRPRRSSAGVAIGDLVARAVGAIVAAIEKHSRRSLADEARAFVAGGGRGAGRIGRRGRTGRAGMKHVLPCIAPDCTNPSKGPRFHYLCEKHMNAPKKDYEAWRARAKERRAA